MPTMTATVREIALSQPSAIRVFESFGIDYCCGGGMTLDEACARKNVAINTVVAALEAAAESGGAPAADWSKASLQGLSEHIVATHHAYVKSELPRLYALAEKVATRHGANHTELTAIQRTVHQLGEELTQHLAKEEAILFPYIAQFERALATGTPAPHGCFGTVENPIAMMTQEHDAAGELLATLRRLSNNYTLPEDACTTYHALYSALTEFEKDLHQHIHLENNILFPKAIAMERGEL